MLDVQTEGQRMRKGQTKKEGEKKATVKLKERCLFCKNHSTSQLKKRTILIKTF